MDGKAVRWAVIEIGSNALKFFLGELDEKGNINPMLYETEFTRISQGLSIRGNLRNSAMERTIESITKFMQIAQIEQAEGITCFATGAIRIAKNADDFLHRVKKETGLGLEILSGTEEAELDFFGVSLNMNVKRKPIWVLDVGGQSCEVSFRSRGKERFLSLPVGALQLTEKHLRNDPPGKDELAAVLKEIDAAFEKYLSPLKKEMHLHLDERHFVGVGGIIVAMARMLRNIQGYDISALNKCTFERSEVNKLVERLAKLSVAELVKISGLEEKRADIIVPGLMIIERFMDELSFKTGKVSLFNILHGVFYKRAKLFQELKGS
jgi:exopolyphosphatase/guanosine-5'-triphosphate,3'-diphosphate pyrophosphatase